MLSREWLAPGEVEALFTFYRTIIDNNVPLVRDSRLFNVELRKTASMNTIEV